MTLNFSMFLVINIFLPLNRLQQFFLACAHVDKTLMAKLSTGSILTSSLPPIEFYWHNMVMAIIKEAQIVPYIGI